MSKIGKMPIIIKNGVSVNVDKQDVSIKGVKGEMKFTVPSGIIVNLKDDKLLLSQVDKGSSVTRSLFGLSRAMLSNMVKGVTVGFEKKLELAGVGYRAQMQGADLALSLGFSHPVTIKVKPGINFSVVENNIIISGIDKAMVGETAAEIRAIRPPEPYKGKGIKYVGEYIRRKAGKAAKAVGTK